MRSESELRPEFLIEDEASLRALFPPTHDLASKKCLPYLDTHARDFIARAPFLCIATQDQAGHADISPRGDPAGFVKVLDDRTLLIPDRPGNNRLDTLANILSGNSVGLIFLIPGFDETLRIAGTAKLTRDPALLETLVIEGRVPGLAIVVSVTEMFLHCAKALRRSRLWDPESLQDRKAMPSLMQMVLEQTTGAPKDPKELDRLDAALEEGYRTSMY